jgi:hypothetical protein
MATNTIIQLVDDLDGSEADLTVAFAIEGRTYEIDLTAAHAEELRMALQPFVDKARRTRGFAPEGVVRRRRVSLTPTAAVRDGDRRSKIRAWAQDNGIAISDRGRIAESVVRAFDQAQEKPAVKAPAKKATAKAGAAKELANA